MPAERVVGCVDLCDSNSFDRLASANAAYAGAEEESQCSSGS